MTLVEVIQLAYEHYTNGRLPQAESIYRDVLRQLPREINALSGLGQVAARAGRLDEAIQLTQKAIEVDPTLSHLHTALAEMLFARSRYKEAAEAARAAIGLNPKQAAGYINLALILYYARRYKDAAEASEQAVRLDPLNPSALNQLACAYVEMNRGEDAKQALDAALAIDGQFASAHQNMPLAVLLKGQLDDAIKLHRQALEKWPKYVTTCSKFLFALHYNCDVPADIIATQHRHWGHFIEAQASRPRSYRNAKEPGRALRLGYVSSDFRRHVVEYFIEPILANHDRTRFHVTGYYAHPTADESTERLRKHFDTWRDISQLSDEAAASLIAEDEIDILIDLSVHSAGNRLGIFARKPAPVQITYLGYPGSTGLTSMDYRITAAGMPSPGIVEGPERSLVLPSSYFCYQLPKEAPPVAATPALKNGFVTFGSFTRLSKMSDRCVSCWSKLLAYLPDAKLRLQSLDLEEPVVRRRTLDRFIAQGVFSKRIHLTGPMNMAPYLAAHHQLDIVLDTFPVNGGATTLHALAMGVPVVSLAGTRESSRLGLNILRAIGLGELVAESEDDWLRIACELANNLPRLSELRQSLRQRMQASALMDSPQFTRDLEHQFQQAWRLWLESAH